MGGLLVLPAGFFFAGCSQGLKNKCEKIHGGYFICMSAAKTGFKARAAAAAKRREAEAEAEEEMRGCYERFLSGSREFFTGLPETTDDLKNIMETYESVFKRRIDGNLKLCDGKETPQKIECLIDEVRDTSQKALCGILPE